MHECGCVRHSRDPRAPRHAPRRGLLQAAVLSVHKRRGDRRQAVGPVDRDGAVFSLARHDERILVGTDNGLETALVLVPLVASAPRWHWPRRAEAAWELDFLKARGSGGRGHETRQDADQGLSATHRSHLGAHARFLLLRFADGCRAGLRMHGGEVELRGEVAVPLSVGQLYKDELVRRMTAYPFGHENLQVLRVRQIRREVFRLGQGDGVRPLPEGWAGRLGGEDGRGGVRGRRRWRQRDVARWRRG